jgi:hypothetical protein
MTYGKFVLEVNAREGPSPSRTERAWRSEASMLNFRPI